MAVTQSVATARRALRVPLPRTATRRFLIGALLGVAVVLGALAVFGESYATRILPGTVLGGVDVSGMTEPQARHALDATLGKLEQGRIELVSERTTGVISFEDVERIVDRDAMLAGAVARGHEGTRFELAIAGLRGLLEPVALPVLIGYDRDRLTAALASFRAAGQREPVVATVTKGKSGFATTSAHDGVTVDTGRIAPQIDALLLDPEAPTVTRLTADSVPKPPVTTDADAERAMTIAQRIARPMTVMAGSRKWTITDARIRSWTTFTGTGADYTPVVDASGAPAALKGVRKYVLVRPSNAQFLRTRGGSVFGVAASSAGRALDVDATVGLIMGRLEAREAGPVTEKPIRVKTMAVAPDLTTSEATKRAPLVQPVGSWTTYYQVSAHNGFSANITVPARRLNGVIVQPGRCSISGGRSAK